MKHTTIYLCKADSSILGTLTGIQTQTCNLKRNATDLWELTFDVNRYIDVNGKLVQSDYYDSVDDMMRLYLDSADLQVFFVIDSEPVIKGDGYQETKTVTAHSVECELCHMYLKNFKINCGTPDSQEYLACETDQNQNTIYYNVNAYTTLPYKYISLVNYSDPQLSLLHLVLQGTGWTVKNGINEDICQIKKSFETSDSVYSFLMKTVSPAASVIFEFDRKHKVVGMVKAADYGEDTGVFLSMRNLMNSFEVTSTSNDNIVTKLIPTGANNLGIESVNFGKEYLLNLDYFMNTRNEYGDYKFVSSELHDSYRKWKQFREEDPFSVSIRFEESEENKKYNEDIKGTRREVYTELTRRYNQTLLDISELKNRVPNDGCIIDYTTYSKEELDAALTAHNNAFAALKTLYKNEYGVQEIGDAPDYLPVPENAVKIKDTPYWHDFYAYKEVIIPKIEESLKQCAQTGSGGKTQIDSYLYEWSLYGLDELQAKKKAWSEAANLLFHESFIASGTVDNPTEYRTADDNGWNSLLEQQKAFTSKSAFIKQLNQYLDYMAFDENRNNSLTKTQCKGIIRKCDEAIAERLAQIRQAEDRQDAYNRHRKELANAVLLDQNFGIDEKDMNVINGMIREQEFSDENIITTSLDDVITTVDMQETLYQSAMAKLHELSQPQYSFHTELDNLYALDAFKAFQKPFDIGNFIRVGLEIHEELCDNRFVKLRIISISHNPLQADENLSVEFSTMTKALNGINDLAFLLGSESGASSGGSSGAGSGTGNGTFGNNDANVQISNNMLNALLRTETFGTAVNDVILDSIKANTGNFNTLISHSGIFGSLEEGTTAINGDCITTGSIKSNNYSPSAKTGSYFDVAKGSFESYSKNGHYIKNDGNNIVVNMGNFCIDDNGNAAFKGDISGSSGTFEGTLSGCDGNFTGTLNGCDGNFTGTLSGCDGNFTGSINVNDRFNVDSNGNVTASGKLVATDAEIKGSNIAESIFTNGEINANKLTAKNGNIGSWKFDEEKMEGLYIDDSETGISGKKYIGNSGLMLGDFFSVSKNGILLKDFPYNEAIKNNKRLTFTKAIPFSNFAASYDEGYTTGCVSVGEVVGINKVYLYEYQDLADNDDICLNITEERNYTITIHEYEGEAIIHNIAISVTSKYTFSKSEIQNLDSSDFSSDCIPNNLDEHIPTNTVGYVILDNSHFSNGNTVHDYIMDLYKTDNVRKLHYIENPNKNRIIRSISLSSQDTDACNCFGIISACFSDNSHAKISVPSSVNGMLLDSSSKKIKIDNTYMTNKGFSIDNTYMTDKGFSIDNTYMTDKGFSSKYIYDNITVSGKTLYIASDGTIGRSGSSKRFKNSISTSLTELSDPHRLYDIDIVQYKYNDDYFSSPNDEGIGKYFIGFIAEDVAEKFKDGATFDKDNLPDGWDIRYMFPAALKLIQEQHTEIESIKKQLQTLKEDITDGTE